MGTILEFDIPSERFALAEALRHLPDAQFEIERLVASDRVLPFVWVIGAERPAVEAAFEADPTVTEAACVAVLEDELLFRIEWVDRVPHLVRSLVGTDAVIQSAYSLDDTWRLKLLFSDRDQIASRSDEWNDEKLEISIRRISDVNEGRQSRLGLSQKQLKTLTEAYERGYFDVPRTVTMGELAETLGVTQQALSEQIRRAHKNLIESCVIAAEPAPGGKMREM